MGGVTVQHTREIPDHAWALSFEVFELGGWRWNVATAKQIVRENPRRIIQLPLATFTCGVGLIGVRDAERVDHADVTFPGLVAWTPSVPPYRQVIDGWARIHRALRDGLTSIPMIMLTQQESRRISF